MYRLKKKCVYVEEIKRSRFIATAFPVDSPDHAMGIVDRAKEGAANHNCYAYRVGQEYRFSDDGEPGGTAGRPILAAIEGRSVDNVLVIVTRYFGGIKLGSGGLVRAYGGTAAKCLNEADLLEIRPKVVARVKVSFDGVGTLHNLLDEYEAQKKEEKYVETGVEFSVELEEARLEAFQTALADATRGKARVIDC